MRETFRDIGNALFLYSDSGLESLFANIQ
uniref:Uncharacterized protein n=1 Tax=Anguilla anguilla TaxID=7936 RepID=A0A0E9SM12_ANGAN